MSGEHTLAANSVRQVICWEATVRSSDGETGAVEDASMCGRCVVVSWIKRELRLGAAKGDNGPTRLSRFLF
jgi:hypothetical protein